MCCRDTVRNDAPRAQYVRPRSEHLPNKEFEPSNLPSIDDSNVHSPKPHFEYHVSDCNDDNREIDHQNLDIPNYFDSTTIDPSLENRPVFKSSFQTVNSERRGSVETVLSRSTTTRTVSPSGLCFGQENLGSGSPDTMHESMELHNLNNTHHERRRYADTGLSPPTSTRSRSPVDSRKYADTGLGPPTSPRSRSPVDSRRTTPRSLSPSDAFFTSENVSRYSPNTFEIQSLDEESIHVQSDSEDESGSRNLTITPIGSANQEAGISTIDL